MAKSGSIMVALAFGVFLLMIAFFAPQMMGTVNGDSDTTQQLIEGETVEITDYLSVRAKNVSQSPGNATLVYTSNKTYNQTETNVSDGGSSDIQLDGRNLTVEVDGIRDTQTAIVTTNHPNTFGWNEGAAGTINNLGLFLVILAGIILLGIVMKVQP
jgi:hypothetical protein